MSVLFAFVHQKNMSTTRLVDSGVIVCMCYKILHPVRGGEGIPPQRKQDNGEIRLGTTLSSSEQLHRTTF